MRVGSANQHLRSNRTGVKMRDNTGAQWSLRYINEQDKFSSHLAVVAKCEAKAKDTWAGV